MQSLVQLETLKALKELRGATGCAGEDDWTAEGGSEWAGDYGGSSSKFAGPRKTRAAFAQRPDSMVREYLLCIRRKCKVESSDRSFHPTDYSERVAPAFSKNRGLYRVHFLLHDVLHRVALQNDVARGMALLTQLCKAVHQAVLDGNSWGNASLLLPVEDPLSNIEWGGSFGELEGIATFHKAMDDLKSSHQKSRPDDEKPKWQQQQQERQAGPNRAEAKKVAGKQKAEEEARKGGAKP